MLYGGSMLHLVAGMINRELLFESKFGYYSDDLLDILNTSLTFSLSNVRVEYFDW